MKAGRGVILEAGLGGSADHLLALGATLCITEYCVTQNPLPTGFADRFGQWQTLKVEGKRDVHISSLSLWLKQCNQINSRTSAPT